MAGNDIIKQGLAQHILRAEANYNEAFLKFILYVPNKQKSSVIF
jgi:hypothetical protein